MIAYGIDETQLTLLEDVAPIGTDLEKGLQIFATLPFRRLPYSARNWGHPLHSLCSYASKMKPAIAATLVALFSRPGARVLDPFSGCGTIPFEASRQGREGIAGDLSPLAYCLSAAKVRPPSRAECNALINELESHMAIGSSAASLVSVEDEIRDFYHPKTMDEILLAKGFFDDREQNAHLEPAHWFVKSCIAHILHGNRPYALSRRSHGIIPIPPKGPTVYKSLLASLKEKASRMGLERLGSALKPGFAYRGSGLKVPLPNESVDAIITSPPFLGTTDFVRQNRLRLWFCGWDYTRQLAAKNDGEFLETHRTLDIYSPILAEFRRLTKPDATVVMHLGVVRKVDMAQAVARIAELQGFTVIGTVVEDASTLESHGRTDRGATHTHQFLFLRPSA